MRGSTRQAGHGRNELAELHPKLEEAERRLAAKPIDDIAPLFGTELRDIRTKIERVKATNPPTYPRGFRLPGARWAEYGPVLAELRPDLYAIVERSYAAAHEANENIATRESRLRRENPPLLGMIPDDGLDEAHGLAGEALDALGEHHNKPFQTPAHQAAAVIVSDVSKETIAELIRDGEQLYDSRADYDRWIADHAAWRERINSDLSDADRIRALDYAGLNEGEPESPRDLRPARQRVDRILENLRELYDEYHRGVR